VKDKSRRQSRYGQIIANSQRNEVNRLAKRLIAYSPERAAKLRKRCSPFVTVTEIPVYLPVEIGAAYSRITEKWVLVRRSPITRHMLCTNQIMSFVIRTIACLCCGFEAKIGCGRHCLFRAQKTAGMRSFRADVRN
jgi:hypothetical protein